MASLLVTAGPSHGRVFEVAGHAVDIGRQGCGVVLDDDTVSRRHARIMQTPAGCEIEDLGSSSGTFVNGRKVTRARLADGDQISIGRCQLTFRGGTDAVLEDDEDCYTLDPVSVDDYLQDAATMAWDPMRAQADLAALYRIGNAIGSTLEPDELVERALDIIVSEFKRIDFCSMHVVEDGAGSLRCIGQKVRDGVAMAERPTFSAALLERVTRNMQSVLSYDAQSDERFTGEADTNKSPIRSALCVPLKNRARLVGVLEAYTVSERSRLTREDLELITAAGQLVGAAVDNALLYDRLKKEKAALEEANARLTTAQEKLVQSEKLSAIGQLTAGIMHDIKNPMAVILGHAQGIKYMYDRHRDAEVTREMLLDALTAIEQGVLHCNAIITDLLRFARNSKPEMMPTQIGELVENTLKFLSHEIMKAGVKVEVEIPPGLPSAFVDEHQIKQVLINIVVNALQAMGPEGRLRVAVRGETVRGRDHIAVVVADTGCGMTEDVKRRIFDPFFTTKKQGEGMGGSGLGLSVSYGIIQSHGGEIDVESEPGKGTTFTIRLPVDGPKSTGTISTTNEHE